MNNTYIQQNYGTFLKMMFETLDRRETTDLETRNNYKEVLIDYLQFIYQLSPLPHSSELALQQKYIDALFT